MDRDIAFYGSLQASDTLPSENGAVEGQKVISDGIGPPALRFQALDPIILKPFFKFSGNPEIFLTDLPNSRFWIGL